MGDQLNSTYHTICTSGTIDQSAYRETPPNPTFVGLTCVRSKTGVNNPRWREQIANHQNATTTFNGSEQRFETDRPYGNTAWIHIRRIGGTSEYRSQKWDSRVSTNADPNFSENLTKAQNMASTIFYKRLQNELTQFSGGVALVELRETLSMIRNPAKALRNALDVHLNDITKYRKARPAEKRRALADSWLEFSFGVAPLVNDLDEAASYLEKRKEQLKDIFRYISASGKGESASFVATQNGTSFRRTTAVKQTKNVTTVRFKAAINTTTLSSTPGTLKSVGLGLSDFVPTLWEAVPWSFLIDYFSNVGDVLQAWSNRKTKLAWGYEQRRSETTVTDQMRIMPPVNYMALATIEKQANHKAVGKSYYRSSISSVPVPDLSFEVPGFGTKWVNMTALVASRKRLSPF